MTTCSFRVSLLFDLSIKLLSELMILSSALMNSRFAADFDLRGRGKFQFSIFDLRRSRLWSYWVEWGLVLIVRLCSITWRSIWYIICFDYWQFKCEAFCELFSWYQHYMNASKTSAVYFFKIIKIMLFLFCILTIMMTIRSIFAFFNVLFIESRIFIVFKVQFSFLRLTKSLLSQYNISCDFGENFLIIRFHSSAFAFAFAFVFAFAFALVTWAAFCIYVSFCVDFCKFCMTCNVCKICVFCKICKFSVICFVLIFFLMFSAFCWINCRMIFSLLFIWLSSWSIYFWIEFSMLSSHVLWM